MKITGVGNVRAKKWVYKDKLYSINQLNNAITDNKIKVTHHICIGLKYFDDFQQKIPREEILIFQTMLHNVINEMDDNIIYDICGSFRRGLPESGDIDVLISTNNNKNCLKHLVQKLYDKKICIDHLTKNGIKKYMGVCKINNSKARRLDIRFIDCNHYWAALLYFTGSRNFNLFIRNIALEKGYSLSEYGLKNLETDELIILNSEKHIFDILNIDYVPPTERLFM